MSHKHTSIPIGADNVIFRLQSKDLFRTQMKYIQDGRTPKHMAPNMQRGLAN